jgi:hypothetical protein
MSYDIYVNETYVGPMASVTGWDEFMDWADQLSLDSYEEIVRLTEYEWVSNLTGLRKQLQAALRRNDVPSRLAPLANRLIAATKKLNGEPESESILWVTDGVNGLINDLIPADDPNHPDPDAESELEGEEDSENAE